MLRDLLANSELNEVKFLPTSVFNAAHQILQWGDLSRLRILFLEGKCNCQLRNLEFFQLIIRLWSECGLRHDNWNVAFELVEHIWDTIVREEWGSELFCIATQAGCLPMIQHLLNTAQHNMEFRVELLRGLGSVGEAVLGNHLDVVEYLQRQEDFDEHFRHVNPLGENLLHLASKRCNPAMFRLLVPRLQLRIRQTDVQGDTALMRIIKSHSDSKARCESARIILLSQADVAYDNRAEDELSQLLLTAVRLGDADMCRLLICDGKANPYSALTRGTDGELILKDKAGANKENVLQLLRLYASRRDPDP